MKRSYIFFLSLLSLTANANKILGDKVLRTSRSFLFPRPVYHNFAAVRNLFSNIINCKKGPNRAAAQLTAIYQHSFQSNKHITQYFLFNCKDRLIIRGDSAPDSHVRDVRAEWLNLPANFSGTLFLCPSQKQSAFVINYNQDLCQWFNWDMTRYSWLDIQIPIQYIENNLGLSQQIAQLGTQVAGLPKDIIEAFNQPQWNFGLIAPCKLKKLGVGEIRIGFGTTFPTDPDYLLTTSSFLIFPTESAQKPTYMFNPFIGTNRHFGLGSNVRFELPLYDECWPIQPKLFFAAEVTYFFSNKQSRIFDLKDPSGVTGFAADIPRINRQWSRYLLFRRPGQVLPTPGVNILTQRAHVNPSATVDLTTGFKARCKAVYAEIGYNIWARNRERVWLVPPCCETGRYSFECFGIAGRHTDTSASCSNICRQAADDECFQFIKPEDISLASGTYPGGSAHRIHGLIGYISPNCDQYFAGFGAFYEIPHLNTFRNWGLWGQAGVSF